MSSSRHEQDLSPHVVRNSLATADHCVSPKLLDFQVPKIKVSHDAHHACSRETCTQLPRLSLTKCHLVPACTLLILKICEVHKTVVRECTARAGSRPLLTSRHCRAYTSTDVPMCTLCTQQAWAVQSKVLTGQALLLRKVHGTCFAFCHGHMVCSQSRMCTHRI